MQVFNKIRECDRECELRGREVDTSDEIKTDGLEREEMKKEEKRRKPSRCIC